MFRKKFIDTLKQKYKKGGTQLEGGVMLPIPGTNAVEFKGNTHEEGGILLDKKTEVENNEIMTKVDTKDGKKDYFFSSYLKKGGLSFADISKDILKNGGTQTEINLLAKMQEKAAKRDPKQIARLGGVVKYATGGTKAGVMWQDIFGNEIDLSSITSNGIYFRTNEKGNLTKHLFKDGEWVNPPKISSTETSEEENKTDTNPISSSKDPFTSKEEGDAFREWVNETYPEYAKEIDLDKEGSYNNSYIKKAWEEYGDDYANKDIEESVEFEAGTYTDPEGNIYERGRTGEWRVKWNKATAEGLPEFGEVPQDLTDWEDMQEGFDPSLSGALTKFEGTMPSIEKVEEEEKEELTTDQQTLYDKLKKKSERRGDVPAVATAAGLAQLGPAAYSMFHKQPDAEQAEYTPGFTSPVVAQMAKAPNLDRVDYNAERARNASQMNQINKYIETSGGGPANIVNKMMAYNKKQEGDMMIAAAESKANTAIANQEAQMKTQVAANNLQRAQSASLANMQAQMQETARKDQINAYNATARQKVKDDEEYQKYQGINTLGTNIAGLAGDYLSYKASERMARVMGSEGIYDRDAFRTVASKEISKSGIPGVCGGDTGIPCTDAHINTFITSQNKEQNT